MPELPEVETIRVGVERLVVGRSIDNVSVIVPKVLKPPITDPSKFAETLISSRFVNARRRGKHLIFGLDSGYALYAHLNMRGQIVLAPEFTQPVDKYLCVALRLDDGAELRYHDIWTWGELRIVLDSPEELVKYVPAFGKMGPEPLLSGFDGELLKHGARKKLGQPIKSVLLDQAVVAGVGNIYADEALFRSGINPLRKAEALTDPEWEKLAERIVEVLGEAVTAGGTASDNYVDVEGTVGRYRPEVYGRAKKNCLRCNVILNGSRLGGRSTVYCPNCQK